VLTSGNIVLLLAGDYSPLEGMDCTRQLVPITGKPLLQRTWEQIQPFGFHTVIVTPHESIYSLFPYHFEPKRYDLGAQTLLSTKSIWGDRTFVLMGDTLYSGEVVNIIMSSETGLGFYGNKDEISGIVFDTVHSDAIITALEQVGTHKPWSWVFYRLLCGFGIREHSFDDRYHFIPDGDPTRDFDSVRVYHKFLEEHSWAKS